MSINRRMIEIWYVYRVLTKLVEEGIDVDGNNNDISTSTIKLINRDEFIFPEREIYKLATISIDPNDPEDALAQVCPHLVTGFF